MLKEIIVIGNIIAAFILFLYGAVNNFLQMDPNSCEMTYMFRNPQFKNIHVDNNKTFSNYGLYYYYEGNFGIDINRLNGAPVLFVPGNGGSYRQVRSLASVSLQKGLNHGNKVHLDYFTIDFAEELTAFYGGYLEKQKEYLQLCIQKIIRFYKKPSNEIVKIVIIGHSMGGIIAESILDVDELVKHILSIIFLSTPLERPVVKFDWKMTQFYENTKKILIEKRDLPGEKDLIVKEGYPMIKKNIKFNDILLISIGGGVRDLQVPAWLTTSKFSNIHAMTSAIPNVWLSCDHLSIVWCLQLMKVVNRFLYSILLRKPGNYVIYEENFRKNIQSAYKYFIGIEEEKSIHNSNDVDFMKNSNTIWQIEESERGYKMFKNGFKKTFIHLMPIRKSYNEEKMYIEVVLQGEKSDSWLYGCIVLNDQSSKITFKKVFSLSQYISFLPDEKQTKSYALIDLKKIRKTNPDWTHILVRLPETKRTTSLHFDIYNSKERLIEVPALKWHNFIKESIVTTTPDEGAYIQIIIKNISPSYLATELHLRKLECSSSIQTDMIIRTSVSWANGFDEYHIFYAKDQEKHIVLNVPIEIASKIDNVLNHIYIDIHLAPSCRLIISQNLSLKHTLKRIVQRFYSYLPAHLVTILIVVLSQHCNSTVINNENIYKSTLKEILQLKSLFIVIGCHLLQDFIPLKVITSNAAATPVFVTILLHGTAIVLSIFIGMSFCILFQLFGNILELIIPELNILSYSILTSSRATFGIIILAISLATCCGLGFLLAFLIYILWLSKESKSILIIRNNIKGKRKKIYELIAMKQRKNFLIHFQLLQLLFISTSLNGIEILAWIMKYPNSSWDPQWISNILTLTSWIFLWEIKDFSSIFYKKTVSLCLYGIAVFCIICGQEFIYTLNYAITFVYISLLIVTSVLNLLKFCICYSNIEIDE